MLRSLQFQASTSKPPISLSLKNPFPTDSQRTLSFTTKPLALPQFLSSSTAHSPQPSHYISTVGSSSLHLSHWNFSQRHLTLLQALAVVVLTLNPNPNPNPLLNLLIPQIDFLHFSADSDMYNVAVLFCNSHSSGKPCLVFVNNYFWNSLIQNLIYSEICVIKAFKRAAESLEKLMDTAREELPDTMAAIRLSGMEISDLTTQLSDLGWVIPIFNSF